MNVIKVNTNTEISDFWNALKIYYNHPNSINKQVIFSENIFVAKIKRLTRAECHKLFDEVSSKLICTSNLSELLNNSDWLRADAVIADSNDVFSDMSVMQVIVRKLIPKFYADGNTEFYEFLFCDKVDTSVYLFTKDITRKPDGDMTSEKLRKLDPLALLKFNFLQLQYNKDCLEVFYDKSLGDKGVNWLKAIFIPKFTKLMSNFNNNKTSNKNTNKLKYESKVDVVQYYKLYEKMKAKYAKYLIENWTENTDPQKFVYEDIGIATYVMMLWSGGNIPVPGAKKQKFVDLGCGNGLLVHILNSEGHLGVGLDIRKRKIWAAYPPTTVLREETIIPTANVSYPEADWLIGNHSDELTAWIPVMARRSNNHCQYFVLPCCPYQLNGMKFQRKNSGLSSYQDFICYVKGISEMCEFETYVDKLRIPSTKRTCLIGLNKPEISEEKICSINAEIHNFIRQECQLFSSGVAEESASTGIDLGLDFKVRESVEAVRNCTKLSQELIDEILKIVTNALLKENCPCSVVCNKETDRIWNRGGKLEISELAACIDEEHLKQLKKECKGLQTLLKNHHFLFEVGQGFVQFRSPEGMIKICNKLLESPNQSKWKRKKCWLFNNHPDKCPLSDEKCSYSHDK